MKYMFLSFNGCLCRGVGTCSNKESRPLEYFMGIQSRERCALLSYSSFFVVIFAVEHGP